MAGFDHHQHALDEQTPMIGLGAMRGAASDDRMAKGKRYWWDRRRSGDERPKGRIEHDQATAGFGGAVIGTEPPEPASDESDFG